MNTSGRYAMQAADSADPMPPFDVSGIYREVYGQVRYPGWGFTKSTTQDSMLAGLPIFFVMSRRFRVSDTLAHVNGIYLLAWKVEHINSYFARNGESNIDSASGDVRRSLVAASYTDTNGLHLWRLFLLASAPTTDSWKSWTFAKRTVFDHPVLNADVYTYVDREFHHLGTSACPAFFCVVGAVRYQVGTLLDAAVRVNTWKAVTGEAPTLFFPNGK
ncbi:MAG: hypothetical protein JST22_19210 [Bacteroidetes bacterium]|nr:hypothetical protein [Bacteroidota bacterium]